MQKIDPMTEIKGLYEPANEVPQELIEEVIAIANFDAVQVDADETDPDAHLLLMSIAASFMHKGQVIKTLSNRDFATLMPEFTLEEAGEVIGYLSTCTDAQSWSTGMQAKAMEICNRIAARERDKLIAKQIQEHPDVARILAAGKAQIEELYGT